MLKGIREIGEFTLRLFFDSFELLGLMISLNPSSTMHGQDRMRALQTSAFVLIILLALWVASTKAGSISEPVGIAIASVLYFSFSSYAVYLLISVFPPLKAKKEKTDRRSEALTITIGFNLIVMFFVALIRQTDVFIHAYEPYGFRLSFETARLITLVFPSAVSGTIVFVIIASIAIKRKVKVRYSAILAQVTLSGLLATLYTYLLVFRFSNL